MEKNHRRVSALLAGALLGFAVSLRAKTSDWDSPTLWSVDTDDQSSLSVRPVEGIDGLRLELKYTLLGAGHRWVQMKREWDPAALFDGRPLTFLFRANGTATMEIKLVDQDGSNFICRYPLKQYGAKWEPVVLYRDSFEYGWGGNATLDRPKQLAIAISGTAENGVVYIDEIGLGRKGQPATQTPDGPRLDPRRFKTGFGFAARRDKDARPEDPGVLAWMKAVQDVGSLEGQLLPSMEDNRAQTYNNALGAVVFILKDERERAERILDFYAAATRVDNADPTLQNFFYKGEPRGFYQDCLLTDSTEGAAFHAPKESDRWIGDMAWLLIAYEYYGRRYDLARYERITGLLTELLASYYQPTPVGGYIRPGWRRGDTQLHERVGHPEGNIDAYAALRLAGRDDVANNVKRWLDSTVGGSRLPLDLYTWRVLALGKTYETALAVPENDLRFRKTLVIDGRKTMGFFHGPATDANNFWTDGIGHMACAYYAVGDDARGNFYANQMDALVMDRTVGDKAVRCLPYTANAEGGYEWVKFDRGFLSSAAWYIFAKNRFNPFTLRVAAPAADAYADRGR